MELPPLVAEEQAVLGRVLPGLRTLQAEDTSREKELQARVREAHREWTDARGDQAQREAFEEALGEARRALQSHLNARRAREVSLGTPYFARMMLEEASRRQEVLLGKVAVVERGLTICDWRDAPVSRLYYEYEEGDEYSEEIGGREREGVLSRRRRVDLREGVLVEVQRGGDVLRLRSDGEYSAPSASGREERQDHRLPDIVSLITREQFRVIQHAESGVVLLRGRAGSGKTTVALHRIAWLHFQAPQRFRPARMMVVMFNKALQTYISRVLPELGIAGVPVETFHGWSARMLRSGSYEVEFRGGPPSRSPAVPRLKRHPAMGELIRAAVVRLGEKSAAWLGEQLPVHQRPAWDATPGEGLAKIAAFRQRAGEGPWWVKLRQRLLDHPRDLWTLFEDEPLWTTVLPKNLHAAARSARRHQAELASARVFDFEDAALLLRFGQLKAQADPALSCPWSAVYAHVVIDEAQDLSTVEIEALVDAADAGRSVTIAGDPAQKILADAQFEGFEQLLARLTGQVEVRLDALAVGHRSTRPIMTLALAALRGLEGDGALAANEPAVVAARDGEPVAWFEGEAAFSELVQALKAWQEGHPQGLVAVLCKARQGADGWAKKLEEAGVAGVRRASRGDFTFQPGVVVSNVHQVKGLEFDGVVLIEPAEFGGQDRHLLHVAITRAAERLWVMASRGRGGLG